MRIWSRIAAATTAAGLSVLIAGTAVKAAEIALMTTAAVEQIMLGLIPPFERASGHKVSMSVFGTGAAVAKIKEGTFADLILLGPDALNELAAAGKVNAGTIAPAFNSRIGLAVRAGANKPDIATADALKTTLLSAKSIGHSHRAERRAFLESHHRSPRHRGSAQVQDHRRARHAGRRSGGQGRR
jgi:molybdate transport system substrate-binding protein